MERCFFALFLYFPYSNFDSLTLGIHFDTKHRSEYSKNIKDKIWIIFFSPLCCFKLRQILAPLCPLFSSVVASTVIKKWYFCVHKRIIKEEKADRKNYEHAYDYNSNQKEIKGKKLRDCQTPVVVVALIFWWLMKLKKKLQKQSSCGTSLWAIFIGTRAVHSFHIISYIKYLLTYWALQAFYFIFSHSLTFNSRCFIMKNNWKFITHV